jgi:hypothetical protein
MSNEVFIVLIINNHYVRWETITKRTTLEELNALLITKYKIWRCALEIGEAHIFHFDDKKVFDYLKFTRKDGKEDYTSTIRVFPRQRDYTLSNEIF